MNKGGEVGGWVFNIQRYSIHDGPGIRTIVFLKGCPLSCIWCDNPESQAPLPELLHFPSLCLKCFRCVEVCPRHANTVDSEGIVHIDRSVCSGCEQRVCVDSCTGRCRSVSGRFVTVEEVLKVVGKDTLFYRNSGGGVTLSGGEATYQPRFALELLKKCTESGFHTCLETCGHVNWQVLKEILAYVDLVLYDIKHLDPVVHKQLTGVGNELILDNLRKIVAAKIPVVIRVPFIPPYNNSRENIQKLGELAAELRIGRIELLPFHQLGRSKYEALDRNYRLSQATPVVREDLLGAKGLLERYGVEVAII